MSTVEGPDPHREIIIVRRGGDEFRLSLIDISETK